MRSFFLCVCAAVAAVLPGVAADLGPEVAVVQIKIGKEKDTQRVVIGLYDSSAPQTVENFKALVKKRFYNGLRFHRVFPDTFVQTGDPTTRWGEGDRTGTGGPGYTLPAEIRLKHDKGAVAMAGLPDGVNPARNSNGSQFYMCLAPLPKLDGKFTVFGQVLEGLDVLEYISNLPTNSNDFPLQKVVIKSITMEPRDASASGAQ